MKTRLHNRESAAARRAGYLFASFILLFLPGASASSPAHEPGQKQTPSGPIPWSEIGASAGAQYQGDGLAIVASERGVVLRCVFQKLVGEATTAGLWLTSTATDTVNDRFRVTAMSVGRAAEVSEEVPPRRGDEFIACAAVHECSLARTGTVAVVENLARFVRPGLVEEYSVNMDGVRQDYIITQKPAGRGELRVELDVDGARAEAASYSARLVLEGSGRRIAYSRLHVEDAQGRALTARMEVASASRVAVLVDDTAAVYPVRIDPTFSDENWISMGTSPGADGGVAAAVTDGSGNLYVGGKFTVVGDVFANNVAKWNGSSWTALGSGVRGAAGILDPSVCVSALAVSGGNLYVGGYFSSAGGNPAYAIAKWDGSVWSALGSGITHQSTYPPVLALAVSGSDLYVGGGFTEVGGIPASNIAKWNGSAWSALGSGVNSRVYALAVSGGILYAGGIFWTAGGKAANRIAKWNGSSWSVLGSGLNREVLALAVSGSELYAGGYFTTAGDNPANSIAKWDGSAWTALGSGLSGGDINGTPVYALAVSGSELYVGGGFTTAGGSPAKNIAKWNGSAWTALGSGLNGYARALAASAGALYLGGDFRTAGGADAIHLAKWSASAWSALALGSGLNGYASALAVSRGDLYVAGWFTTAGGSPASNIAKWNGTAWSALGSGLNGGVEVLAVSGSDLYVAGWFTTAGGSAAANIAKWDGSAWTALGSGVNGGVNALAVSGGDLYAGGNFSIAGGSAAANIAKWDGSAWTALGSGLGGGSGRYDPYPAVYALAVRGSDLYVGGAFTTAGGNDANHLAKWDGSAWTALGAGLDGADDYGNPVYALAVSGSDLYAGGWFTYAGSSAANCIAKWDGTAWTALGSGLEPYYFGVRALAVSGGDLYVGGEFTTAGGSPASNIAKWNGTAWSLLGSGVNSVVYALAVSGSDLYAGGNFSMAGGKVSAYVARAYLERPTLSILLSGGDATLSWPSFYGGFVLQQNPDVGNTSGWSNATSLVTTNGAVKSATVPISPGNQFFRLLGN